MAILNNSTTALNSSLLPDDRLTEQLIESFLAVYIMPVIIAVGTMGNLTSLAVLMRRRMRRTSVYLYLTALALADISVLYVSAFKTWIRLMTGFELMHVSNMACSLVTFLLNVVLNVAAWLIVLTTVDRFVAVWLPLHAAAFCRRRRARLAALTLVIIAVVASIHLTWTTGLHHVAGRSRPYCGPSLDAHFLRHQYEYIRLASYSLVPFAIILTLNVAIIVRLRCGKAASLLPRGNSGDGGGGGEALQAAMTSRVTYMLLAVSATWLVLSLPFMLQALFAGVLVDLVDATDVHSVARYGLFRTVCFQLIYINHAVNFFLYCVTGRKFRHELRDMYVELCCGCRAGAGDRCRCGGRCVGRDDGATHDCGHRRARDATQEPAMRHGEVGQELMIVTTCRSIRGSSLLVQSSPVSQRADSSL